MALLGCVFLPEHTKDHADGPTHRWTLTATSNPTTPRDAPLDQHAHAHESRPVDTSEMPEIGTVTLASSPNQTPTASTTPIKHRQTTSSQLVNDRG